MTSKGAFLWAPDTNHIQRRGVGEERTGFKQGRYVFISDIGGGRLWREKQAAVTAEHFAVQPRATNGILHAKGRGKIKQVMQVEAESYLKKPACVEQGTTSSPEGFPTVRSAMFWLHPRTDARSPAA